MRRKGILGVAIVATLIVGVGVAFAAKNIHSTKVVVDGVSGTPSVATVYGHLDTNSKCLGPRLLEESKQTSSGFKPVDFDYSSAHGAFAFRGDIGSLPATLRIEVAKAKVKNRKGRVTAVCKPAAKQVTVSPSA